MINALVAARTRADEGQDPADPCAPVPVCGGTGQENICN
jgi:hypothetical protein